MSDQTIGNFLDLSNAHLTQKTCEKLDNYDGVIAYRTEHGWSMYVTPAGFVDEEAWPQELGPIIELARSHGCWYIHFDADGAMTEDLPTFDW